MHSARTANASVLSGGQDEQINQSEIRGPEAGAAVNFDP